MHPEVIIERNAAAKHSFGERRLGLARIFSSMSVGILPPRTAHLYGFAQHPCQAIFDFRDLENHSQVLYSTTNNNFIRNFVKLDLESASNVHAI
jgi:hypothetical protein